MLWGVQMRFRKKMALAGIFSLVIITMIFATIRIIAIMTSTGVQDLSWVCMWSAVERVVSKKADHLLLIYQLALLWLGG